MFDTTSTRRTFVLPKDAPALCGLKKKKKLTTKSLSFIMMSDRVHTNDEIFKREGKKRRAAAENYPSCVHVSLASEGVVNFCFTRKARPEERECSRYHTRYDHARSVRRSESCYGGLSLIGC